jgi:hypothetical protein
MPIQFTQTVNEGPKSDPVAPIVKQFLAAESNGTGEAAAAIFSQVAGVTSVHDAHLRFMMDEAQVRRWAPVVADFLARHGVK